MLDLADDASRETTYAALSARELMPSPGIDTARAGHGSLVKIMHGDGVKLAQLSDEKHWDYDITEAPKVFSKKPYVPRYSSPTFLFQPILRTSPRIVVVRHSSIRSQYLSVLGKSRTRCSSLLRRPVLLLA
jgi:hypothetical protein